MNSLEDLNGYSSDTTLEYTDSRPGTVLFDRASATNQSLTVNEGATFPLSIGIEIVDIIEPSAVGVTMTVDVSSFSGLTVDWGTTPAGITVTEPSTGVYLVEGIDTLALWDAIKQPNIILPVQPPNGFYGVFTYDVSIAYYDVVTGNETQDYTVTVTVLDITILSNPLDQRYDISTTTAISNTPQIEDYDAEYPGATWTITGTPNIITSIDTFSSSYSGGGTFSFNNTSKVFTISGTRAQVNGHLNLLSISSNSTPIDFVLAYNVTNNQDAATDTKYQAFNNIDIELLSNPTLVVYYNEDTEKNVTTGPQITDDNYTGTGSYTVTITPTEVDAIETMSSNGSGGTSSFNGTTKVLTITGTKTEVNSHLADFDVDPATDYDSNFILTYQVTKFDSSQASKVQNFYCGSNDGEITNMNVIRSYTSNTPNSIFTSNTPEITDLDQAASTYTISFNCSFGKWSSDGATLYDTYSYSGTKAQCNSHFSSIVFYPNFDVSSNGTFTYTQLKDGVTQVSQSVSLTGSEGTYGDARILTFLNTSYWTPTLSDVMYGRIDAITLVGGGGGGSAGGGGGGQVKYSTTPITLSDTTYTITVGAGGAAGNSNISSSGGTNGSNGGNTVAFGITALGGEGGTALTNWSPFTGATGGGSYAPDGTYYAGGTGLYGYDAAPVINYYAGGGGAGSGGRNGVSPDNGTLYQYSVDAYYEGSGVTTLIQGSGGLGYYSPLGGVYGYDNYTGVDNGGQTTNFGAGGEGGFYNANNSNMSSTLNFRATSSGYMFGKSGKKTSGAGGQTIAATLSQDSPRTIPVAGQGGGGGALGNNSSAPPATGGDGIVIFSIGSK